MARRGLALDLSETGYVWRQKSESLLGTQSSWKRLLEKPMSVGRHLGDALRWKVLDPEWKHCFRGDASGTFAQSCGILDSQARLFPPITVRAHFYKKTSIMQVAAFDCRTAGKLCEACARGPLS